MIVVAFHTTDPVYTRAAESLQKSLDRFQLRSHIETIEPGEWAKSAAHKPRFLLSCLRKFPNESVLYTDADSCFVRPPDDALQKAEGSPVAYVETAWKEILAGTILLPGRTASVAFVERWIKVMDSAPLGRVADQTSFQIVVRSVKEKAFKLPSTYCTIFDLMRDVVDPIIVHYQASRIAKHGQSPETLFARLGTHPQPRKPK